MNDKLETFTCHRCGLEVQEPFIQTYGDVKLCAICIIREQQEVIYGYQILLANYQNKKDVN